MAGPVGIIEIHDNATGCNSQKEVEAACGVGLDESAVSSQQSAVNIFPNPPSTTVTISRPTSKNKNTFMTIYNISGQQLQQRQITEQQTVVDVSGLSTGIYIVKVVNERMEEMGKFVKQ